jgi:tRNA(Ile)-lysidine synthase
VDQCTQIIASFDGIPGKIFKSDTPQLIVDREQIILEIKTSNQDSLTIKKEGSYFYANYSLVLKKAQEWTYNANKNEEILQISPDLFPLTIRNWENGDRFTPLGMKGSKLLSDFFIDQKINVLEKNKIPLLCAGEMVLWVVGHQISDLVKVSENKNVYRVSYINKHKSN